MSSMIFDCPALFDESLVPLADATKVFPVKCSLPTLHRWINCGCRGVKLETVIVGGTRYTSKEAIRRFLVGQQRTEPEKVPPKKTMTQKEIEEKSKRFKLPEPEPKKPR